MDLPVVDQEKIRNPLEPRQRLLILKGNGLVTSIPAGHHQITSELGTYEVVKRGVRKHNPKRVLAGRNLVGKNIPGPFFQNHNRTDRAGEKPFLLFVHKREPLGSGNIRRHDRKRPMLPVLSPTQPGHRLIVCSITGKMIAADPLDGQNAAILQKTARLGKNILGVDPLAVRIKQRKHGSAFRTGIRLGMKPPV